MGLELVNRYNRRSRRNLLNAMHADRKAVFVDMLGWDVPVIDGAEQDAFDNDAAEYLIVHAQAGEDHLASLRLLRTDRPHLLDTLFTDLCEGDPPRGEHVREISRLCVSPRWPSIARADCTALLASALVDHALLTGIETYTAVSEMAGLSRVLAAGWRCAPLGLPRNVGKSSIGAVRIDIDVDTVGRLSASGFYRPGTLADRVATTALVH